MEAPDTQHSGSPDIGQTIGASAEADEAAESASMRRAEEARRGVPRRRKLSDEQEREVTRLYAETSTPTAEIARRFGIAESSVYRVTQRHGAPLRGRPPAGADQSTRCRQSLRPWKCSSRGRAHRQPRPRPRWFRRKSAVSGLPIGATS